MDNFFYGTVSVSEAAHALDMSQGNVCRLYRGGWIAGEKQGRKLFIKRASIFFFLQAKEHFYARLSKEFKNACIDAQIRGSDRYSGAGDNHKGNKTGGRARKASHKGA
jgi:hypothetical protein